MREIRRINTLPHTDLAGRRKFANPQGHLHRRRAERSAAEVPLPPRDARTPRELIKGQLQAHGLYLDELNTKIWTPDQDIARYLANPAGEPPEAYQKFALAQRARFEAGRDLKFLGASTLENEYLAAKDMIEASREMYRPDDARFLKLKLPTHGSTNPLVVQNADDDGMCQMFVYGEPKQGMLLRWQSSCLWGEALDSAKCDCGDQLEESKRLCAKYGGILTYMFQPGRNAGDVAKHCGYVETDTNGASTYEAFQNIGLVPDGRTYLSAVRLLDWMKKHHGVDEYRMLGSARPKAAWVRAGGFRLLSNSDYPHGLYPMDLKKKIPRVYLEDKQREKGYVFSPGMLEGTQALANTLEARLDAGEVRAQFSAAMRAAAPETTGRTIDDVAAAVKLQETLPLKCVVVGNSVWNIHTADHRTPGKNENDVVDRTDAEMARSIEEPGGKALTAAVAAAQLGNFDIAMVTRIAAGWRGDAIYSQLANAGIRLDFVSRCAEKNQLRGNIVSDPSDSSVGYRMSLPYMGMPNQYDAEAAEAAIKNSNFVYLALDLELDTIKRTIQLATDAGVPVICHAAPVRPKIIAGLGAQLSAVDILFANRVETAALLGFEHSRLNAIPNEELAAISRAKTGVRGVIVSDPRMGMGGSAATGGFTAEAAEGENSFGTVGAKDLALMAFMAKFGETGDFAASGKSAAEAAKIMIKHPSMSFVESVPARAQIGLRAKIRPPRRHDQPVAIAWGWQDMSTAERLKYLAQYRMRGRTAPKA